MNLTTFEIVQSIFLVFGGLGLFLYGMRMMMDGLEKLAGSRMRSILKNATSNRFLGVSAGTFVTIIMQSSTATTVMVVSFVNAGLLSLTQSISLIMGSNIGTTLTAHMLSFKIDTIAPLLIFVGIVFYMFIKKKKVKNTGFILLSIGIVFFGLSVMSGALKGFANEPAFQELLTTFENPVLAVMAGFLFTAIIQSSTAATSIIVTLYLSGIDLNLSTAMFLVLGINIGNAVTGLIASLAASRESKRAALSNFIYGLSGSIVFGTLIYMFPGIIEWFKRTWSQGNYQIAMFYSFLNIATTLMLLPFVKQISKLMYRILPKLASESVAAKHLVYIGADDPETPKTALAQARRELYRMGMMSLENLRLALDSFFTEDCDKAAQVLESETTINYLNVKIASWLVHIKNVKNRSDTEQLGILLYTTADIERIGDHAENIAEYTMLARDHSADIPEQSMKLLVELSDAVLKVVEAALDVFDKEDMSNIQLVERLELTTDVLAKECVESHIQRFGKEPGDPRGGMILTSMASDLERCADHALNIAHSCLGKIVCESSAIAAANAQMAQN